MKVYDDTAQAWKDAEMLRKYDKTEQVWKDCECALKHNGEAWEETWSGKKYVVKNGVVLDTSTIDNNGGTVSGGNFIVGADYGGNESYGAVKSSTLTNLSIEAPAPEDADEGSYYIDIYAKLSTLGFYKPSDYNKLVIKGTYSNVEYGNLPTQSARSGFGYASGQLARYKDSISEHRIYNGEFEEVVDLTGLSRVIVKWHLYGSNSAKFTASIKITDMYFE